MTIMSRKEFEEMPDAASVKDAILAVLKRDPEHAYSTSALAKAVGSETSITGATKKLADAKLVNRKRIRGEIFTSLIVKQK